MFRFSTSGFDFLRNLILCPKTSRQTRPETSWKRSRMPASAKHGTPLLKSFSDHSSLVSIRPPRTVISCRRWQCLSSCADFWKPGVKAGCSRRLGEWAVWQVPQRREEQAAPRRGPGGTGQWWWARRPRDSSRALREPHWALGRLNASGLQHFGQQANIKRISRRIISGWE